MSSRKLIGAIALLFLIAPSHGDAQSVIRKCADGSDSHPATASEAASAPSGGVVAGVTQLCPEDAKVGISAEVGEAKQYLKSLPRTGSAKDDANIDKLNDKFAICAAKFFKAYIAANGGVSISSAYRSPEYDERGCSCRINPKTCNACGALKDKPASQMNGNHQRALAIDVWAAASPDNSRIRDFAIQNPQYGVCFPFAFPNTGFYDRPHMIPMGGPGTETRGAGCRGVQNTCDVGTNVPVIQGTPGSDIPGTSSFTPQQVGGVQGLMQGLQNFFSPPPVPQCPAGYTLLNGQCLPSQAQAVSQVTSPFSYATPAATPAPATSNSGAGTTGTNIGSGINISGLIDTTSDTKSGTSTSAIDLISALANPTTTTGTPVGRSVALNDSLVSQVALNGVQPATIKTLSASNTYALNAHVSDTFVSADLSKTPIAPGVKPTTVSTFALLENIRLILVTILTSLRPFGGGTPSGQVVHPGQNSLTAILQ